MDISTKNIKKFLLIFILVIIFFIIIFTPIYNAMANHGIVPCHENCKVADFITLVKNIIFFLIENIAIPIAVISFVWAGWLYLTAGGNQSQIDKAHAIFMFVFIGLLLTLGAWLIVKSILGALGVTGGFNVLK